jgi:hypothetical protein
VADLYGGILILLILRALCAFESITRVRSSFGWGPLVRNQALIE